MTTDNHKKYEEAAKQAYPKQYPGWYDRRKGFLAGASFVEKEKQTEIDELEAMMQHVKSVEKEAHNAAIDKAIGIIMRYSDTIRSRDSVGMTRELANMKL